MQRVPRRCSARSNRTSDTRKRLGLIKLLLAGRNGHIPATLFSDNPTEQLDWDATSIRLATKLHPWEPKDGVRYGAVSSYGAGGANSHAVIAMPADL